MMLPELEHEASPRVSSARQGKHNRPLTTIEGQVSVPSTSDLQLSFWKMTPLGFVVESRQPLLSGQQRTLVLQFESSH